jgi:hypothetical protein
MNHRAFRFSVSALIPVGAWGCAVPATEVQVPTMSMRQALDATQASETPIHARQELAPSLVPAALPPGAQRPLLSTPDIRLAYLYEWVDEEGDRHFGEWVAIPISGFHWIMSDGSRSTLPLAPSGRGEPAQSPESR